MEDTHSRAYGLAHSQIFIELLTALIESKALSEIAVRSVLMSAGADLLAKRTDVSIAASEHVKMIAEAVGVAQ